MSTNNISPNLDLGLDAYASDDTNTADLLKNLEGCRVHRFSEGTGEHAGTALMIVELADDAGLGVQVSMEVDTSYASIHPNARQQPDGSWAVDDIDERRTLDELESPCPNCRIVEVVQKDIMDPENARVLAILDPVGDNPYALDIHIDEDGGTEFFETKL
ncbi:hypothetical protein [Salinibaculum rarum]|uniref:hypothetical protein n=1 Tax=Salinibaculum rarum TaxID=3058903 RepID=UPI00265F29B0|nr:hypothetical protein [Salinibaculum sp. KK48]